MEPLATNHLTKLADWQSRVLPAAGTAAAAGLAGAGLGIAGHELMHPGTNLMQVQPDLAHAADAHGLTPAPSNGAGPGLGDGTLGAAWSDPAQLGAAQQSSLDKQLAAYNATDPTAGLPNEDRQYLDQWRHEQPAAFQASQVRNMLGR